MSKVITAKQAAELIRDGDCIAWTTAGLCGFAEYVAAAIETRFLETQTPRNLTLFHCCGCGDHKDRGTNHLGYEGLVTKVVSGHIGEAPKVGKLINEKKAECHLLPQGVLTHLLRQMAGKKPGVLTKVGLGTFVDPRNGGGKVNDITKDELVELVNFIDGEEYLYFKPLKQINVAVIRGSTADVNGNMTMDREALFLEALPLAMATKATGGIVIAQVMDVAKAGTLHPKRVKVPAALVDYVVPAPIEHHMQTKKTHFIEAFCGDSKMPMDALPVLPLTERKVICRRAAMELEPNTLLNLGIGMPDGVASVCAEEGVLDLLTMSTELGNFGGMPGGGPDFPASYNSECTIDHPYMFDFYDGGGLDACVLGMAEVDAVGNVNVSKFGPRVTGPGGFINISSTARKVVFVGTLTSGLEYKVEDGTIKFIPAKDKKDPSKDAKQIIKFVESVEQITFSGEYGAKSGRKIMYVTERAVFELRPEGLTLVEIAPGLDPEKDVFAVMGFKPLVAKDLKEMPKGIFMPTWGELGEIMGKK